MGKNKSKDKILWKPALEVFSGISTWIAGPIIIAVILGKYLDNRYNTGHWLLLGSAALAFFMSSYGIVREVKRYSAKIKKEEEIK